MHTVGIDRVIERAGVAKASLYNTFGSKDELVRVYLEGRHAGIAARITRYIERYDDPRGAAARRVRGAGRAVRRAGVPRLRVRQRQRRVAGRGASPARPTTTGAGCAGLLTGLARDAGAPDPEPLGRQLHMIYDGASLSARMDRDPSAAVAARAAAAALLDAALAAVPGSQP